MEKRLYKILLIEDDYTFSEALIFFLQEHEFNVIHCDNSTEALSFLNVDKDIDLVILDLNLPDLNGDEVCERIKTNLNLPIIILSAESSVDTKIKLFELGSSDYLVKPVDVEELLARINIRLNEYKKMQKQEDENIIFKEVNNEILFKNELLSLNSSEKIILTYLIKNKNVKISKEFLNELLEVDVESRMVDKCISSLRKKIETNPKEPEYIKSGYKQGVWLAL